ncbi:potassium/sodium efflux P-type ATPase [Macrophomina phaseolina]|uniref:P-type Na(+) transporter n=1 Tax=Macrophomina phaseolina TaxID=35725 RepID=A0ABQ8GC80_9PEZI|nr:potassium/sodium efflux P-type ATPase [Macrophomina phaseolina]
MGIDDTTLDVEETTEPPIRGPVEERISKGIASPAPTAEKDVGSAGTPLTSAPSTAASTDDGKESSGFKNAHTVPAATVAQVLGVDPQNGLTRAEAAARLERDGLNKVEGAKGLSLWKILLRQVSNSLTLVLVIVMALSFGIDDYIEGGVITAVILLNIVVGFVQDYHAEKAIMSLYALSAPVSKVMRDGSIEHVKAETVVVGDVVHLNVGDIVPADLRLIDGINVSTDEALLTGESLPVTKTPHKIFDVSDIPVGDRTNMAYSATTMSQGRATGIVVATGVDTEVGQIAEMLRSRGRVIEGSNIVFRTWNRFKNGVKVVLGLEGTPLQIKLSKFALLLFALAILLVIIVFSAAKWDVRGEVLIYGICVGVAVIPESLIAVLTITIAVGTKAMAKGNVIVRKLSALEAVGGVTNICSDKTGTLTQGKMIARKAWIPSVGTVTVHDTTNPFDPSNGFVKINDCDIDIDDSDKSPLMDTFLKAIALCNLSSVYKSSPDDASVTTASDAGWVSVGEPTEIALQVLAMRFNYGKPTLMEDDTLELLAEFPFDSNFKRMAVIYKDKADSSSHAYMKGAVEVMLPALLSSDSEKNQIVAMAEEMAGQGLRVLCVGHKLVPDDPKQLTDRATAEANMEFVGLVGLYDPPRLESADAVRRCQMAGITVHMLTGDHIKTATAIAHEVGILSGAAANAQSGSAIMPASDFDKLSDEEIDAIETLPLVLARCSPKTKVRMVQAMHRRKAFCVMTGDGVNDAPALRISSVGVAMGLNGSDVAKEAADMVLTDDNFASIVKAVEEGRRLFDNIQKFLLHLLISNISQVLLLLIGLSFKDSHNNSVFPLSPLEILWVNLITSSFLALGLGVEEAQPDIMLRPPHDLRVGVFTPELIIDKFIYGFFMGALCIAAFTSVAFGVGDGAMGEDCNEGWNDTCGTVFRARATTYATLSFLLLVTAWEVKHFARSLFNLYPQPPDAPTAKKSLSVFAAVWRNRFLFWAVVAGFVITFPVVYIPVINREVFKHQAITWEWGIVVACLVAYIAAVESWKACKRRFGFGTGKFRMLTVEDAEMRAGLAPALEKA